MFVPADRVLAVAQAEGGLPFDVPDVELDHKGERCSFDAFLDRYGLDDPALRKLAVIVRGADNDRPDLAAEAAGLYAIATGFQRLIPERFPTLRESLALELEKAFDDVVHGVFCGVVC